ncbi:MAG TPA: HigA family addiction module antitoxin [archaeon]|nr:HigA family addiction module antitoxin [archaeon]
MINAIQSQFQPDYVSPPGDTLQEVIDTLGMTQKELALRTGITKKTINQIVKGLAGISPETAVCLERTLGVPSSFWNNLECLYQAGLEKKREQERLHKHKEWLKQMPVIEMVRLGWIRDFKNDKLMQLKELLNYFGVASPETYRKLWDEIEVAYRKSTARQINQKALAAWLRQGELQAKEIDCNTYDKKRFLESLWSLRSLTVESPDVFVPKAQKTCAECGVLLLFIPELPKTGISGAARWLTQHKALIQLSLRYKTNDHLWFSFFHEAAHILKHNKGNVFLDSKECNDNDKEQEANRFASNILISPSSLKEFKNKGHFTTKDIIHFAKETGVHPGIVVGRLQHDKIIPYTHFNSLKMKLEWSIG